MKKLQKGFTLIELLIVIIILAILIAIVVGVAFQSNRNKAYDIDKKSDIATLQKKLEEYFVDNNTYPLTADFESALVPDYLSTLPTNPANTTYTYTSADGTSYTLSVELSNSKDNGTNTVDCGGNRCYEVTSSQ